MRCSASAKAPLVVSLDGRSGAGKSTRVAGETGAAIVPMDEFFAAYIPDAEWDRMTIKERGMKVFDWARIRSEVVEPLLSSQTARWYPLDFDAGLRADGTYGTKTRSVEVEPASVIIIDGVYSSGPQLADLVSLAVLVEVPDEERRTRLARREEATFLAKWHVRWDAVEDLHFSHVRPRSSFDLIVTT